VSAPLVYNRNAEIRGLEGAIRLAYMRPRLTADLSNLAASESGPLSLERNLVSEERRQQIREATRRWRQRNPDHERQYREAHRDSARERDRRYRQGHADQHRERARRYAAAHREERAQYQSSHPEQVQATRRRYYATHAEQVREQDRLKSSCRRARKRNAEGTYDAADVAVMLRNQKGRCWWCRKPMKGKHTIDHRIALARGGSNDPGNLVLSCPRCNRRKHTKTPQEFAGRLL